MHCCHLQATFQHSGNWVFCFKREYIIGNMLQLPGSIAQQSALHGAPPVCRAELRRKVMTMFLCIASVPSHAVIATGSLPAVIAQVMFCMHMISGIDPGADGPAHCESLLDIDAFIACTLKHLPICWCHCKPDCQNLALTFLNKPGSHNRAELYSWFGSLLPYSQHVCAHMTEAY